MLFVDTSYAAQISSDACRDLTKIQQYVAGNMPESLWYNEHFIRAGKHDQNKQYEKEIAELQLALQAVPNSDYAGLVEMTIGDTYSAMKEYDNALTVYRKILQKYPNSVFLDAVHYNIATALYKGGNSSEAEKVLEDLISKSPNSTFTSCAKQNVQDIKKKISPVFLTDALQDHVDQLEGEVKLYEKIVQAADQSLKGFEKDINASIQDKEFPLKKIFNRAADKDSPVFNLGEKFLEEYPDSDLVASVYYSMIIDYYSLLNIKKSAEIYRRMKKVVPKDNPYLIELQPLAEEIRPVLELIKDADTIFNDAQVQSQEGNYIAAITSAEHFLSKFSEHDRVPEMLLFLGKVYFSMKKYNQARMAYEKITEYYSDASEYEEARWNIGRCYAAINEWQLATQNLEFFLEAHPKNSYTEEGEHSQKVGQTTLAALREKICSLSMFHRPAL
ncbi:tetratricopeptide repeat protein [Candidatus Electrothrix sp.]|uniref:tetratricopeptide repeat protein n=1 Tax=Candidatus Electrothrix sp. TaxID=2170559 RepID=UPI0040575ADC